MTHITVVTAKKYRRQFGAVYEIASSYTNRDVHIDFTTAKIDNKPLPTQAATSMIAFLSEDLFIFDGRMSGHGSVSRRYGRK